MAIWNSFQTRVSNKDGGVNLDRFNFLLTISLGVDAVQLGNHIQQGEPQC